MSKNIQKCRQGPRANRCGGWGQNQSGNVLFIILIAVALFAALTAAVTRSNQGGASMDRERGTISASDLMSFAGNVEKTVARMLSSDMSENGLSFENTVWQLNDNSQIETAALFPNCTTDACKIFHPAGGGIEPQTFAPATNTGGAGDIKSGHAAVYSLKIAGVGTAAHDMVLLFSSISLGACKQINSLLNIENPSDAPPADSWAGAVLYNGTFGGPDDATDTIGDVATQVAGKPSGCVKRTGGGDNDNYFYQVLLPR